MIYDDNSNKSNEDNKKNFVFIFCFLFTFSYFSAILEIHCQDLCIYILIKTTLEKCYLGCYDIATNAR